SELGREGDRLDLAHSGLAEGEERLHGLLALGVVIRVLEAADQRACSEAVEAASMQLESERGRDGEQAGEDEGDDLGLPANERRSALILRVAVATRRGGPRARSSTPRREGE